MRVLFEKICARYKIMKTIIIHKAHKVAKPPILDVNLAYINIRYF